MLAILEKIAVFIDIVVKALICFFVGGSSVDKLGANSVIKKSSIFDVLRFFKNRINSRLNICSLRPAWKLLYDRNFYFWILYRDSIPPVIKEIFMSFALFSVQFQS
jgi:hypothetical protein